MATFSSVSRQHVLLALAEYDERGADDFLAVYGFAPSRGYTLVHEGRSYDSKAVLGVAHRIATGRLATSEEFSGGMHGAVAILRKRGFEVTEPATAARAPLPRTSRAPASARTSAARPSSPRTSSARAAAARDTPAPLCPTCSMTLPATGTCDYCY